MNKFLVVLALVVLSITTSLAQFGSYGYPNAKYMGLGGSGSAVSQRITAIGVNPASMLARTDTSWLEFNLPLNIAASASNNSLSLKDVKYYFGDTASRYLTSLDKQNLISAFENDGKFNGSVNINHLTIGLMASREIGAFALSVNDNISTNLTLPKEMVQLLLNGNQANQTYTFNDLTGQLNVNRTIGLSYARQLYKQNTKQLRFVSVGATAKYVQGFANIDMKSENTSISTSADHKINGSFSLKGNSAISNNFQFLNPFDDADAKKEDPGISPASVGSGIGFDIGFAAEFQKGIRFGLSVTDIGSMNWSENAKSRSVSKIFKVNDLTNQAEFDSLTANLDVVSNKVSSYSTDMPTALRIGASVALDSLVDVLKGFTLNVDYMQGFNNVGLNSSDPRIAVGLEMYPFEYVPRIALGIGQDQTGKMRFSGGIGYTLSFMDFYLSTFDLMSIGGGTQASVALQFIWRIY
jgi:hypothetical protein